MVIRVCCSGVCEIAAAVCEIAAAACEIAAAVLGILNVKAMVDQPEDKLAAKRNQQPVLSTGKDAAALQYRQGRHRAGLQPQLGARLAIQPRSPETNQPLQLAITNLLEHTYRRTIPEGRQPALYPASAFTSINSLFQQSQQLQSQIQPAQQSLPSLRPTPLGQLSSRLFLQTTQPYLQKPPPKKHKASPIKVPLVLTSGETHTARSIAYIAQNNNSKMHG
ncbi:hypothetical protein EDB80DRAFT_679036 [Ilyonectria destructans]|nr:hypothetical protein EDB80DRAFT_679036 [Ilyonectria destructans]